MDCKGTQETFSEYFDGELDEARREGVKTHLAMCTECAAEYRLFQKSLGVLHDTGPIETREGFESYVVTAATQPIEAIACAGHEQLFSDFYDGSLGEERRREVESHLMACAGCRADYAVLQRSLRALAAKGPVSAPLGFELMARRAAASQEAAQLKPSFAPAAVAAAVVVAFAIGYLIQRSAASGRLEEQAKRIESLKKDLEEARRPVDRPDNIARIHGVDYPIEEYLARHFDGLGLVKQGNGWVPREWKERFERGESIVDGKWVNVSELIRTKAAEIVKAMPPPPVGPSEEEILAKHDLVRLGELYLPRSFFEAVQAGRVLKDGKWHEYRDVVAEILRDKNLVEHDGRWMTESERQELLAASRIQNPGSLDTPATRVLEKLAIAAPMGTKNLTIYPLTSAASRETGLTTLHDALGSGKVEITDASPLLVKVKNLGETNLVLLGGEILLGGRCARVVVRDTVVEAKKTETVDVADIEPLVWRTGDKFVKESGHFLATPTMRAALAAGQGQGAVWGLLPKGAPPMEGYKAAAETLADTRAALIDLRENTRDVVGVVVAIGDRVVYAEIFADHAAFCASYERILRAAALDAVGRSSYESNVPNSIAGVKQMLEWAFTLSHATEGDGLVLRRDDGSTAGRALLSGGAAAHLVLFAGTPAERRPGFATEKIDKRKGTALMLDYEARWKASAASGRMAMASELEALPLDAATQKLVGHLGEADTGVKRAVILALGRRRDPAAVPPLLELFDAARKDAALFPAVCESLSRLGDGRAVDPLMKALEGREAEGALVAAAALPKLLLQLRDRGALQSAMGRLIDAYDRALTNVEFTPKGTAPFELPYPAAIRTALHLTTGKAFGDAAEARGWWNREGKKFLEERTK
jgi:anti-sigma factor RsiW